MNSKWDGIDIFCETCNFSSLSLLSFKLSSISSQKRYLSLLFTFGAFVLHFQYPSVFQILSTLNPRLTAICSRRDDIQS